MVARNKPFMAPDSMRALVSVPGSPVADPRSVAEIRLPVPKPGPRDLLVQVQAVAVNPRDYKQRALPFQPGEAHRLLGWDAAGVVVDVGPEVTLFQPGQAVFYAGTSAREGCNAQWHAVDERLVGPKPQSLGFAAAAALPLTGLTAWEALVDRLGLKPSASAPNALRSLLVIGGAGGVGSIAIQLAAKVLDLRVTATASTTESAGWCRAMGAANVIDHTGDLVQQARAAALGGFDAILILNAIDQHFQAACELLAPQGGICAIVEPKGPLDMTLLRRKSGRLCWELMFTRSVYQTPDMIEQHHALSRLSALIDQGVLQAPLNREPRPLNALELWKAYRILEEGHAIGKVVMEGW